MIYVYLIGMIITGMALIHVDDFRNELLVEGEIHIPTFILTSLLWPLIIVFTVLLIIWSIIANIFNFKNFK